MTTLEYCWLKLFINLKFRSVSLSVATMESTEKCQHKEPEVGLLLDLDSLVIHQPNIGALSANGKSDEELANKPQGDCDVSESDPPSREEVTADDKRSAKSSTERSSQGSESLQESPNWLDFADEHLIESEKFDFDLPVSPVACSKVVDVGEEDEVFFGPVGFTETCVAKKTQLNSQSPTESKPLSPLNVEQYLELFLEANKVAMELAKRDDDSSGSSVGDEPDKDKEASDADSQKSHLDTKSVIQEDKNVRLTQLPQKPEPKDFKRLVKKEMRSPRRGTYTVSVTPVGTPPPQHLPSADECVSHLVKDKPRMMQFSAAGSKESKPQKESKLPLRGLRKSKLPMKASLKKAAIPQPSSGTCSTDKLLRKKINSPPKRKRLNSCESDDISEAGSSVKSETFETPIPHLGIPKGKRPISGNLNPKERSGVGLSGQPGTTSTDTKATGANVIKAPVTKPSLLQGSVNRRMVQANRSLKLVKPGQHGSLPLAKKLQPVKAVAKGGKAPSTEETPKKTVTAASTKERSHLKPQTPSTPIHQLKTSLQKRILSSEMSASKPTPRSLSTSSVSTPPTKMPTSTPSHYDSKSIPASAGSARRRSGIPTPARQRPFMSSSRSSMSSVISNPSPIKFRISRTSTTTPSPSTPHPVKPFRASTEGAIKLELDPSPVCIKEAKPVTGRPALETKTNSLEVYKSSPVVDLLVDFSHESPAEKLPKATVCQANTRIDKENPIDLL